MSVTPLALTDRILLCLERGEMTRKAIAAALGVPDNKRLQSTIGNLYTLRRLVSRQEHRASHGSSPCYYRLPEPWINPVMTAGEWLPWHPTGSVPSEVRRLVIQQEV